MAAGSLAFGGIGVTHFRIVTFLVEELAFDWGEESSSEASST